MVNYDIDKLSYKNDLDSISIPKFQRGLVWNKSKKEELLKTLHKGFPFGTLLVSADKNDDEKSNWMLLDGQQRLSTIKEYERNKFQYWVKLNPDQYNEMKNEINGIINDKDYLVDYEHFIKYFSENFDLARWTDRLPSKINIDTKQHLRDIIRTNIDIINEYIDLDTLLVPIIKFTGSKEFLPEVFENLNKGGVPLSKYEVFNASWNETSLILPYGKIFNEILDIVKNYYIDLQEDGEFDVSDFSEDEISSSREINLAEFARALGEFIVTRIPSLVSNTDEKSFNELGYGLLAIITNTPNNKTISMDKKIEEIQTNLSSILNRTDYISKNINIIFDKLLKQNISFKKTKKSKKSVYSIGLSTSFKILSYFADLWDKDETNMKIILNNIPLYYIYDSLNESWTAHGDKRLYDYYPKIQNRSYEKPLDKKSFNDAFKLWTDDNKGNRKSFSKEVKALITIHSNLTYMAKSVPYGEDFEFEHIIPKAKIVQKDSIQPMNVSSLGNGMFLPKSLNNKKKDKTLYSLKDSYNNLIKYSCYPSKKEFDRIFINIEENEYEKVNSFIDSRSFKVAKIIFDNLNKNFDIN